MGKNQIKEGMHNKRGGDINWKNHIKGVEGGTDTTLSLRDDYSYLKKYWGSSIILFWGQIIWFMPCFGIWFGMGHSVFTDLLKQGNNIMNK